jgi:hypothetical protein
VSQTLVRERAKAPPTTGVVNLVVDGDSVLVDGVRQPPHPDTLDARAVGIASIARLAARYGNSVRVRARDHHGTVHLTVAPSGEVRQTRPVGSPRPLAVACTVAMLVLAGSALAMRARSDDSADLQDQPTATATMDPKSTSSASVAPVAPVPPATTTAARSPESGLHVTAKRTSGRLRLLITSDRGPVAVTVTLTDATTRRLVDRREVTITPRHSGSPLYLSLKRPGRWRWQVTAPDVTCTSCSGIITAAKPPPASATSAAPPSMATSSHRAEAHTTGGSESKPANHTPASTRAAKSKPHKPHLPHGPSGPTTALPDGPSGE